MESETWHDVGSAEDLARKPLRQISVGRVKLALAYQDNQFSAISGVCNHAGGPLGDARRRRRPGRARRQARLHAAGG